MKTLEVIYRRSVGEELSYVCSRLDATEAEILGKALRRGLLEIYKAVVLHELAAGRIDRQEAMHRLGGRVVERSLSGRKRPARPRRPATRRTPSRRSR